MAPWATALLVLVSITARAGEEPDGVDRTPTASIAIRQAINLGQANTGAPSPASVGDPAQGDDHVASAPRFGLSAGGDPMPFDDGATPMFDDSAAQASATPTLKDDKILVLALPVTPPAALAAAPADPDQPDYAALIPAKDSVRQMRCLAEAVYFESRSEPLDGQAAVAHVVLNRVRSGLYPNNVCGVVYQDRERAFACQFSFACEGKSLQIQEPGPWAVAMRIAKEVVNGERYDSKLALALNYHANYVYPPWAPMLKRVEKVGNHIFYAMKPGVIWAPGAVVAKADPPAAAK